MLGKPQDCSLACKLSGPCFGHLSPDTHPKGRGDAIHHGTHLMKCGSCRETLLSPGLVVLGHTCRTGPATLQSMRHLVEEGSPYFWGLTVTARLSHPGTVTALDLCCPTACPTHPQQHWQAAGRAPQDLAPQATSSRISPNNLRAGSSFPSSQQIPAQPEIQVFKGKASEPEVTLSLPSKSCTSGGRGCCTDGAA